MNRIKPERIIMIIYPLVTYYLLYNMLYMLLGSFTDIQPRLLCLALSSGMTIPVIYRIYKGLIIYRPEKLFERDKIAGELIMAAAVIILGIVLNIIFTQAGITGMSDSFKAANKVLYDGNIFIKIMTLGILIPTLEELVYRGCICGQMMSWHGEKAAILVSAGLFGIMHMNPVQIAYGCIMGMALGYIYCKTGKLWVTIVTHGLCNIIIVIATAYIRF